MFSGSIVHTCFHFESHGQGETFDDLVSSQSKELSFYDHRLWLGTKMKLTAT